jgi:TP901 family phage tail tape measure protein
MAIDLGVAEGHIDLDFGNLQKGVASTVGQLQQLERAGNLTESQLRLTETATKGAGGAFNDAAQKSKRLSAEIEIAKQKAEAYKTGISGLNEIIKKSQTEYDKTGKKVDELSKKYEASKAKVQDAANAHGKESEEYQKAVKASQGLNNQLLQEQSRHASLGLEIDGSKAKINEYAAAMNNTQADIQNMGRELSIAESKMHAFGVAAEGIGSKMQSAGKAMSKIGGTLSLAVTAPLVTAGTAAYKWAESAETSYAKVSTIADSTKLSYDQLKTGITDASNQTGVAVTDLNEALYQSISAGVDSGKALGFTTDMVKLARGGFTDTAKAVDVVTSVLNAYGLSADNASSISDKLITTQNIGKTTVDQLASSLGRVIPTAKANNVAINDVCTAMAIMTKRGIDTAEATTYYNSMLNGLGKSGTAADKALRKMSGEGFSDLVAKGKPVTEILQMLQDYAGKSGKKLSDMFEDVEGGKAALSIMSDGGKEYNEVLQQMANSAGAAQSAADKMDATPAMKMQKELNKIKNEGIEIGEKLIPYAEKGMSALDDLVNKFDKLSDSQKDTILKSAGIVAAGGPVLKVFGSLTSGIGKLTSGIGKIATAATEGKAAADVAAKGVGTAASEMGSAGSVATKLGSAIGALPTPLKVLAPIALAAGVAIAIAVKNAHDAAVSANLEQHFGKIELSLKECQKAAKNLTASPWKVQLDVVSDAKKQLDKTEDDISDAVERMNKYNYMVSVDMKLSAEDTRDYQSAIESFVKSVQNFVKQKQYTADVAIRAVFGSNSETYTSISKSLNSVYKSYQDQANKLSDQISILTADAMKDGVIDADESAAIDRLKEKLQGVVTSVENQKFDAHLKGLAITTTGTQLSFDSLSKLSSEITKSVQEQLDSSKEAYQLTIDEIQFALANGAVSDTEAKNLMDRASEQVLAKDSELVLKGFKVTFGEIEKSYGPEIEKLQTGLNNDLSKLNFDNADIAIRNAMHNFGQGVSSAQKDAMKKVVDANKDSFNQLDKQYDEFAKTGKLPYEGFLEEYRKMDLVKGIAGIKKPWSSIANAMMNSSDRQSFLDSIQKNWGVMDQGLKDVLEKEYGLVMDSSGKLVSNGNEAIKTMSEQLQSSMKDVGLNLSDSLAQSLSDKGDTVQKAVADIFQKLKDGKDLSADDLKNYWSDLGASLPDECAASLDKASPGTQKAAADLMLKMQNGTQLSGDEIKTYFKDLGLKIPDQLVTSLNNKAPDAQKSAVNLLSQLENGTSLKGSEIEKLWGDFGLKLPENLKASLITAGPDAQKEALNLMNDLTSNTKISSEQFDSLLKDLGLQLPDSLASGLRQASPSVQASAIDLLGQIKGGVQAETPELITLLGSLGISLPSNLTSALADQQPNVQMETLDLLQQMHAGVRLGEPELATVFKNLGMEPGMNLTASLAGQEPNVQASAISLLGQLRSATDSQRPSIIQKLNALGIDADRALSGGIDTNAFLPANSASNTAEGAKSALTGAGLEDTANTVGSNTGANLAGGISGKSGDVSGSASGVANDVQTALINAGLEGTANTVGSGTGSSLAGGLSGQQEGVSGASKGLADNAKTPLSGLQDLSSAWGSDMASNFASGISGMWDTVSKAAGSLANAVKGLLHFSRPDYGPMRDYEKWPVDFVNRYAELLKQSSPVIEKQSRAIAERMRDAMTVKPTIDTSTWESVNDVVQGQKLPLKQVLKVQYDKDNANTYKQAITDGILSLKGKLQEALMAAAPKVEINNHGDQQMGAAEAAAAFHREQIKAAHGL